MYNITRNSNKYLLIIFPTSVAFAIDRIQRGYFAVPSSCSTGIRVCNVQPSFPRKHEFDFKQQKISNLPAGT